MLSIIVWVTLGAFVGWIASLLLKTDDDDPSTAANLGASIVGAVVGGGLASLVGHGASRIEDSLRFQSVLFSGVGAMVFLLGANLLRYRRHHPAP